MTESYMCPKCGSVRVAFRRGAWMQCKTCDFGADKSEFGPVHVDKTMSPMTTLERWWADSDQGSDA